VRFRLGSCPARRTGRNRISTFGTWSTATSYLGATFDLGFEASRVTISSLDAGSIQFSLGSTQITQSTGGLVTTSSGVYGPQNMRNGLVTCGETVNIDYAGLTSMVSINATTTGRSLRLMAFGG
jgi:hypothetical protein